MGQALAILCQSERFTHSAACRVCDVALSSRARTVRVDLTATRDATTSAFARLVVLRRLLLRGGRDLVLSGLQGRTARVWEISRLEQILPRVD